MRGGEAEEKKAKCLTDKLGKYLYDFEKNLITR